MRSKLAVVALVGLLGHACVKKQNGTPPVAPKPSALAVQNSQAPDAATRTVLLEKSDARPPLTPFTNGKRVRIKPIDEAKGIAALTITLPKKFKVIYTEDDDFTPIARVVGPNLKIDIGPPESFLTLKERIELFQSHPDVPDFLWAEETAEGFMLVYRSWVIDGMLYDVLVSRPQLKVLCIVEGLTTQADAELAASICLSLQAAEPKSPTSISLVPPEKPVLPAPTPQAPDAAPPAIVLGKPEPRPPLTAFTAGKRVRIKPLEEDMEALEITVPKKFKLRYESGYDLPFEAHFIGPDLKIEVFVPLDGINTLKRNMTVAKNAKIPPVFFHAGENEEGCWLVSKEVSYNGRDIVYYSRVYRPPLKVGCAAGSLETLENAELAASICLSLRAAQPKNQN